MSTYTQVYYHIVFGTKHRAPLLVADKREHLFRYIDGIIRSHQGCLYRVNGVEDHVHLLTSLHATVCLADLIKDIKIASTRMIKEIGLFPGFNRWQDGYGAFTCSYKERNRIAAYIARQVEHHHRETPVEELRRLLAEAGVEYDPQYLE